MDGQYNIYENLLWGRSWLWNLKYYKNGDFDEKAPDSKDFRNNNFLWIFRKRDFIIKWYFWKDNEFNIFVIKKIKDLNNL